jgi:serine/threonine protein phosphatase PrpC
VQIVSGGVTNVGRVRTNNEDSFRIVEPMSLYILSDGMGGEAHGEIASAMAVDVVAKHCSETEVDPAMTIFADMPSAWSEKTRRLSSAVHLANKTIFDSAAHICSVAAACSS